MSTILKSGLCSTFSLIPPISVILHTPLPQSLCSPKQSLTNLTEQEVPKIIVVTGQKVVNNKQYISQFWFLKLTKQIKFKFCFCLILCYKAFLTVLVNILYNIFFDMVIYNEHIPQDIPLSVLFWGRNSLTLTLQLLL